jgi:hypothetical protein
VVEQLPDEQLPSSAPLVQLAAPKNETLQQGGSIADLNGTSQTACSPVAAQAMFTEKSVVDVPDATTLPAASFQMCCTT